jgi:hypothetical protein
MQPDMPIDEDPQVLQDEFAAVPVLDDSGEPVMADALMTAMSEYALLPEIPCYGVACVEGIPDGAAPRRMFAPGGLEFAPTPFSFKWQIVEADGHDGSVVIGRVDAMWRDGALIRWLGCIDNGGQLGPEAARMIAGGFVTGTSIMADDTESADIEYVYVAPEDAPIVAAEVIGEMLVEAPEPNLMIIHSARVRSLTLLPEAAFVECRVYLGISPDQPPMLGQVADEPIEVMQASTDGEGMAEIVDPYAAQPVVAAAYTITIPDIWPESWFEEPTEMPPFGALHITPQGRVFGLLGPSRVDHRAFRAAGQRVEIPRGIDYSEFQNKPALVAGADGHVYRINAGNITFDCGHASPFDSRREDPTWAASHYDNTCSIAARIRVGENSQGTWVAGALMHGMTPDAVERMMASALSGDWQGGKLNAALLVPVEGFPTRVAASVRVRDDAIVASCVPMQFDAPEVPEPIDYGFVFDLIASANGRPSPMETFDTLTKIRFDELARG